MQHEGGFCFHHLSSPPSATKLKRLLRSVHRRKRSIRGAALPCTLPAEHSAAYLIHPTPVSIQALNFCEGLTETSPYAHEFFSHLKSLQDSLMWLLVSVFLHTHANLFKTWLDQTTGVLSETNEDLERRKTVVRSISFLVTQAIETDVFFGPLVAEMSRSFNTSIVCEMALGVIPFHTTSHLVKEDMRLHFKPLSTHFKEWAGDGERAVKFAFGEFVSWLRLCHNHCQVPAFDDIRDKLMLTHDRATYACSNMRTGNSVTVWSYNMSPRLRYNVVRPRLVDKMQEEIQWIFADRRSRDETVNSAVKTSLLVSTELTKETLDLIKRQRDERSGRVRPIKRRTIEEYDELTNESDSDESTVLSALPQEESSCSREQTTIRTKEALATYLEGEDQLSDCNQDSHDVIEYLPSGGSMDSEINEKPKYNQEKKRECELNGLKCKVKSLDKHNRALRVELSRFYTYAMKMEDLCKKKEYQLDSNKKDLMTVMQKKRSLEKSNEHLLKVVEALRNDVDKFQVREEYNEDDRKTLVSGIFATQNSRVRAIARQLAGNMESTHGQDFITSHIKSLLTSLGALMDKPKAKKKKTLKEEEREYANALREYNVRCIPFFTGQRDLASANYWLDVVWMRDRLASLTAAEEIDDYDETIPQIRVHDTPTLRFVDTNPVSREEEQRIYKTLAEGGEVPILSRPVSHRCKYLNHLFNLLVS